MWGDFNIPHIIEGTVLIIHSYCTNDDDIMISTYSRDCVLQRPFTVLQPWIRHIQIDSPLISHHNDKLEKEDIILLMNRTPVIIGQWRWRHFCPITSVQSHRDVSVSCRFSPYCTLCRHFSMHPIYYSIEWLLLLRCQYAILMSRNGPSLAAFCRIDIYISVREILHYVTYIVSHKGRSVTDRLFSMALVLVGLILSTIWDRQLRLDTLSPFSVLLVLLFVFVS